MSQLSVNQLTTMCWSMAEDATFYAQQGIQSIGLSLQKVDDFGISKTNELLSDLQLQVSSYGTVGFTSDVGGRSLSGQILDANRAIRQAAELSANCLIIHTGGSGMHLRKNRFNLIKKAIDCMLPNAEEHGVKIAIEPLKPEPNCQQPLSHNLNDCCKLVESYCSPKLGLNLDTFHVGNELFSSPVDQIAQFIFQIQLSDYFTRNGNRFRCAIGTGELLVNDFWRFVDQCKYDGVFEIEMWGEAFDFTPYESIVSKSARLVGNFIDRTRLQRLKKNTNRSNSSQFGSVKV